MPQTVVVLLHGAGVDAWVWDRVRPLMQTESVAPSLRARAPGVTPAACAARLISELHLSADARVVLVMHSLSGVLAGELGRQLGSRLRACIYVAAVVPAAGSSFAKALGFPARLLLPLLFRFNPNGLRPSDAMLRAELCGDLSAEDSAQLVERYQPEFPGLFLSPVVAAPTCRSVYVKLTSDKSVSPTQQDAMIAQLPSPEVAEIASGHMAMLSRPDELAAIINRTAT